MHVKHVRPAVITLVAMVLIVGSVMAASPSPTPSASTGASPTPSPASAPQVKASPDRDAAETPEPPETAEPPEPAEAETPGTPPTADQIARVVAALKAAGITATTAQVQQLATKLGLGQAVRVLAFANASNKTASPKTPDAIVAMFEAGKGWGQIKKELSLSVGPGIGWIMGHGHGGAPKANPKP